MKKMKWLFALLATILFAYGVFAFATGGFTATIKKQTHIAAPPEAVWTVLTDVDRYAEWNPFLVYERGRFAAGESITLRIKADEKDEGMRISPRVLVADAPGHLRWKGRFILPYIFDGTHQFTLTAADGGTFLVQEERFAGLLIPLTRRGLLDDTAKQFERMNDALKERVENMPPTV